MSLKLTNTLTGRKEAFQSIQKGKVSIYCCGVTVYDLCHIGHARSYIVWDVLRRYLIWNGYSVTFVQNFTDIDDKILNRAAEENTTMSEVSERNIKEFHKDMDNLGILRPDKMPRATKCLDQIRSMISQLERKGAAYSTDGDVYFAVMKHKGYGKLSGRDLAKQQLNADGRITDKEKERKQNPFDFALWKGVKNNEPSFPSPWGDGRPGWHIECSAMVLQELGETIDIHLGGADLVFPHHENEMAQSEIATGKKLANYWLHNGMVNVGGKKMSKSIGNFTTIRALLKDGLSAMTVRLFILQAHYRKPIDFTPKALNAAASGWNRLNEALCLGNSDYEALNWPKTTLQKNHQKNKLSSESLGEECNLIRQRFVDALNDDLNTSAAVAVLFDLARPLKSISNKIQRGNIKLIPKAEAQKNYSRWLTLVQLASVLGLEGEPIEESTEGSKLNPNLNEIKQAIKERNAAKLAKDFEAADRIREALKDKGIELVDKGGGVTDWIRI